MSPSSANGSLRISALEGRVVLNLLNLPTSHLDPKWTVLGDGLYEAANVGVTVRKIFARGCPVEYEIEADPDHHVWAGVMVARINLAGSVRVRADARAMARYVSYLAFRWGDLDVTQATYALYSYMLRSPVDDFQSGDYPRNLADAVFAQTRILFDAVRAVAVVPA